MIHTNSFYRQQVLSLRVGICEYSLIIEYARPSDRMYMLYDGV